MDTELMKSDTLVPVGLQSSPNKTTVPGPDYKSSNDPIFHKLCSYLNIRRSKNNRYMMYRRWLRRNKSVLVMIETLTQVTLDKAARDVTNNVRSEDASAKESSEIVSAVSYNDDLFGSLLPDIPNVNNSTTTAGTAENLTVETSKTEPDFSDHVSLRSSGVVAVPLEGASNVSVGSEPRFEDDYIPTNNNSYSRYSVIDHTVNLSQSREISVAGGGVTNCGTSQKFVKLVSLYAPLDRSELSLTDI
jgi:hypothetical protein